MKRLSIVLVLAALIGSSYLPSANAQQVTAPLPNNQYFTGVDLTSVARPMIGVNRSNVISIDPDARGTTVGGALTVTGASTLTGAVNTTGALTVGGLATANAGLTVTGAVVFVSLTSASTGDFMCWNTSTGAVTQGTATCTLSSAKYKTDITDIDAGNSPLGLMTVMSMRPVTFTSRIHPEQGRQPGFIAEEAALVDKRLVFYSGDGQVEGFRYQEFTAVLTRAIQQQQLQIDSLENMIEFLKLKLDNQR